MRPEWKEEWPDAPLACGATACRARDRDDALAGAGTARDVLARTAPEASLARCAAGGALRSRPCFRDADSAGAGRWSPVIAMITEDLLCFTELDQLRVSDCIPMNEVRGRGLGLRVRAHRTGPACLGDRA